MKNVVVHNNATINQSNNEEIHCISILKYMGNKKGLLKWLMPILRSNIKHGDTIIDLFAGTSSVGYALKKTNKIIANDIQSYSTTISRALLKFNDPFNSSDFSRTLSSFYTYNKNLLSRIFLKALKDENEMLTKHRYGQYRVFVNSFPTYIKPVHNDKYNIKKLLSEKNIQIYRKKINKIPYILFSTYYANSFFSLSQCVEIDSLRYAIDKEKNPIRRDVYLSCLMYALSQVVNSTGHFAEYLEYNQKHSQIIFKKRKESIMTHFLKKIDDFEKIIVQKAWNNQVYCQDAKDLIHTLDRKGVLKKVKLIYIDPPYTNAQYSRYYHIPETLVKYDYPEISVNIVTSNKVKGGYRTKRIQSDFSQTTQAEKAFSDLFSTISSCTKAPIAISYSDTSLLKPIDRLISIVEKYYHTVQVQNGHYHSAQGSKFKHNGERNNKVNEYVIICKNKRK